MMNTHFPFAQQLSGLKGWMLEHQPTLLILCHGGNDIIRKRNSKQTVKNLGAMIKMAQERNIEVVLVGVPAYGLFLSTADFYREVAEEFNLPFEGESLSDILADNSLKSDMIHPNSKGYRAFAETIANLLRQEGAIQ
jgi:acyl-CoA thioesterase I